MPTQAVDVYSLAFDGVRIGSLCAAGELRALQTALAEDHTGRVGEECESKEFKDERWYGEPGNLP